MSGGKAVQQGVRVKLSGATTWDQLSKLGPEQIKDQDLFPDGFQPLPHPNHSEGGMLFPKLEIDEIKKREGRDLARFGFGLQCRYTTVPKSAPTPAVIPMARAPQNVTRIAPAATPAPPTRAATPPRRARKNREAPETQ